MWDFPLYPLVLLKFIILFNKMHVLFDFKIPFKIKIIEKQHTVLIPDIFVNCSSQKLTYKQFFKLKKSKF